MFQITALAKNVFKAPVCARIATDKVDSNGETAYAEAHFIALFESASQDEAMTMAKELDGMDQSDLSRVTELVNEQTRRVFIGFEKHPKHPMPFKDGDADAPSSAETIKQLLNCKEVSDAVRNAYNEARAGGVPKKNLKK